MSERFSWEHFRSDQYVNTLGRACPQCHRSHVWDNIKIAIINNNLNFLRLLLGFQPVPEQMPFSQNHLASIILKTEKPESFRAVLEMSVEFMKSRKWRKCFERQRQLFENWKREFDGQCTHQAATYIPNHIF